jgi:ABC-type branched-subunit amino acid transport system substrate-binding protein
MQIEAYSMYNESIQRKLAEIGREVVFVESYEANTRDFKNIVNKLSKQNPDFVYAAGAGESAALFTKQLFSDPKTNNIPVIGDMNFSNPENLSIIGELKAPVSVVDNYLSPEFVSNFKTTYCQTPNAYAVYGYIIPYLLKSAFDTLGINSSSKEVYDYIHNNVINTAAGNISFNTETTEPNLELIVKTQMSDEK